MAIKPESRFIGGVHKYLVRSVYRMKNHNAYVGGIPDVWYSADKSDLWIEYKYLPIKSPRNTVTPDLSLLQVRWITQRLLEGRDVWVIVGCKSGGVIYTDILDMTLGIPAERFKKNLLSYKELAQAIYEHCSPPQIKL